MYLPQEELFGRASVLLGVDSSYMEKHLMVFAMERKVVLKEEGDSVLVYPSRFYLSGIEYSQDAERIEYSALRMKGLFSGGSDRLKRKQGLS